MKIDNTNKGFTAIELIIVVSILCAIAAILLPALAKSSSHNRRVACVNNLRQVGIGMRLWASDHGGQFPLYHETNGVWNYFQTAGRYIGSPKVLVCPKDTGGRKRALDFEIPPAPHGFADSAMQNNALSYFYGVDASEEKPEMILTGDRSVSTNETMLSGILTVHTNTTILWPKGRMHDRTGNIAFADGSVAQQNNSQLGYLVRTGTNGAQRLLIP